MREFDMKRAVGGGGYHDKLTRCLDAFCLKKHRGVDAKRQSLLRLGDFDLYKKFVDILSLFKRNILISPLEGEKKFLSELNELRNFREGYNLKYSCPVQHETVLEPSPAFVMLTGVRKRLLPLTTREGCDSVISSDFKSKISITNENNLSCKDLSYFGRSALLCRQGKELSALVSQYLSNFPDTVFSRFTSHFSRKRTAFTLAEVLITLGIIGIVAALTVPNLVQGYRKHVVETRLKEFYTITQQAFKMAEVDNGDIANWGRYGNPGNVYVENDVYNSNSDEWFDKYISPYLKEEKRDLGAENFTASRILRVLPNGSAFAFNVNAITFFPFADDYYKCAQYVNDLIKKCSGRKYFLFKYYQDSRITPFDYPNHSTKLSLEYSDYRNRLRREQLVGNIGSCSKKSIEANREAHYCAELIMLEGWKIPKDYPFRF